MAKNEKNSWENEPPENEKLKDLVRDLAHAINSVFAESNEIRTVIKDIEEEGYQVDLVLASITRAMKGRKKNNNSNNNNNNDDDDEAPDLPLSHKFELSPFDLSFLKSIKVKEDPSDLSETN